VAISGDKDQAVGNTESFNLDGALRYFPPMPEIIAITKRRMKMCQFCTKHGGGTAKVNDTELYYETKGVGDAVVLLHGFTLDTRMWDDQFDILSESYFVVRFDMRGHGRSAGAKEEFSQAEDVKALLDFLEIDQAHVVGLSMGGSVAMNFALDYPDRVRSLVFIDSFSTLDIEQEFDLRLVGYTMTAAQGGLEVGLRAWLSDPLFEPANKIPSVKSRLEEIVMEGHLAQGDGAFFLNALNAKMPDVPPLQRLDEITVSALVLIGELDLPRFKNIADALAAGIARSNRVVIQGAGHMSNMENVNDVNDALLSFLASQR
jgi:pimeloyl-ACP methyl ester carboxylesterase